MDNLCVRGKSNVAGRCAAICAGRDPSFTGSVATTAVRRVTFNRSAGNPTQQGKRQEQHRRRQERNTSVKGNNGNVTGERTTPLRAKMSERARSGVINSSVHKSTRLPTTTPTATSKGRRVPKRVRPSSLQPKCRHRNSQGG